MYEVNHLAEQHILQSESHLQHIDELMAKAHESRAKSPLHPKIEAELVRIQGARDKGAEELAALRQHLGAHTAETLQHSEGLKGTLENVGLELEKALTAVFKPVAGQPH